MKHYHDESEWPIIWEVLGLNGKRLTMLVQHTYPEALEQAHNLYGPSIAVVDTGKRKPPNKCCNKCGNTPCK